MASARLFPLRYGLFRPLLSVLGIGPRFSGVEVEDQHLRVRMGWSFRADVPLNSVAAARPDHGFVGGIGVHGWRGEWLVNGAASGLVRIEIAPPARARVLGVPVRLRTLRVSVESPDELLAALADGGVQDHRQQD
ncbi:MAG: hypothetical protein ACR2KK_18020 [Acidimicrobiales bacterium]